MKETILNCKRYDLTKKYYILEIDNTEGNQDGFETFDYYFGVKGYGVAYSFGWLKTNKEQFTKTRLLNLYRNGYFDYEIEEITKDR